MKKLTAFIIILIPFLTFATHASALQDGLDDIYSEQFEASGADKLADALPDETADYLCQMNISPDSSEVSVSGMLSVAAGILKSSASDIFKSFSCTTALIIMTALISGATDGIHSPVMKKTTSVAANAAVCIMTATPAAGFIADAANAAESCCRFDEVLIPVYSAITAASGSISGAAGYSGMMSVVLELTSLLMTGAVMPVLRVILAVSLVSSLSPSLKLGAAVKLLEKYLKWMLGFISAMAVGVFSISSVCAAAADSAASRAAKYIAASTVPVLGSAMGEALSSVTGCVRMLRASVGGFGMTAMAFILIPPLIRGALWQLHMNICSVLSDALGVKSIKELADSVGSVISIMTAVILFTAVVTIFTLGLTLGRGGGT